MEMFENMYPMISPDGLPSLLEEEYGMELDDMLDRFVESDKVEVIPAVGRKVYIAYPDVKMIFEEEVYALGRDSFILKCFSQWTRKHCEFKYSEYYQRWFLDVNDAKKYMERYLEKDEILEEGADGKWWVKPF